MADDKELMLHEMHYDKDGLNMKLSGEPAQLFMYGLMQLLEQNGGKNFLTMTVEKRAR